MPENEARRYAYIALGGKAQVVEECRDQRGIPFLEHILRDCRLALRAFSRSPASALAIVLTIGLCVGANSTVFAFCKAMLLATLPVPNPQQLYLVSIEVPGNPPYQYFSFPNLQKVQNLANGTATLAGFTEVVNYSIRNDSGTTSTIKGQLVTGNFFSTLQVSPIAGRAFNQRDNDPGQQAVALLSYRFWKQRFGGDHGIIGKRLLIQRKPVIVLAIMPRDFEGMEPGVQPDIWMPLSVQAAIGFAGYASMNGIDWNKPWLWQDVEWVHVLARSSKDRDGKGLHALLTHWLKAEVAAQLPQVSDARQRTMMLRARVALSNAAGGLPRLRTQFSLPLRILMALVAVLLCSGCVNIVNLLLARCRTHEHETTIRVALGSSRRRLIASTMTETLLLVIAGGLLSLPIAAWGSRVVLHWLVINRDLQIEIPPDWSMVGFTAAVTLFTGLLVGLIPALRTADLATSGKLGQRTDTSFTRTRRATRLSSILVAGQLALSITSLVIAGLLTRTLLNYERLDVGMDRQHVLSVGIDPSAAGYNNAAKLNALYPQLTEAIDSIPGVISSAVAGCGLMNNGCATISATVPGAVRKSTESLVERNFVGPGFFQTVGMQLLRGRGISEQDTLRTAPVGVVNVEFERQFLNGQSSLGRVVRLDGQDVQIIGVVKDARSDNIHRPAGSYLFLPVEQARDGWNISHIEVRTHGKPEDSAKAVRTAILAINRAIPVAEITTLAEEVKTGLAGELLVGRLAGLFSILTLLIAAIGLYGIFAYEVNLRRPEFGVRIALGATKGIIFYIVFRRAALIWIAGSAIGLLFAIFAARFIEIASVRNGNDRHLDLCSFAACALGAVQSRSLPTCSPCRFS